MPLKQTFLTFTPVCSVSSCEAIEVEMCRGLSYNLTSFPNIWLSIADQREAASLLQQYRVKTPIISSVYHCRCVEMNGIMLNLDFNVSHPGSDGSRLLPTLAEAGVRHVSPAVQPSGGRPAALPLRLLLC